MSEPDGQSWTLLCPHHGVRARIEVEDEDASGRLEVASCSLLPGGEAREGGAGCPQSCLNGMLPHPKPASGVQAVSVAYGVPDVSLRPLLIPVDDPELTTCLLWHVEPLLRWEEPDVVLLEGTPPDEGSEAEDRRERLVGRLEGLLRAGNVQVSVERQEGALEDAVLARVSTLDPSLVLVASSQRRSVLAQRLLRHCSAPLLLFNPDAVTSRFRRILVPLDGSDRSESIVPLVVWFGAIHGSHVILLHVSPEEGEDEQEVDLHAVAARMASSGLQVTCLTARDRDPAQAILASAELEQADLVAMTTHGRSAFEHWAFGSVAEKVFHACRVPLLVKRVAAPPRTPVPVCRASGWGEPPASDIRRLKLGRVLLPLDGSAFSERSVRVTPQVLGGRQVSCCLFRVLEEGAEASRPGALVEARERLASLGEELGAASGWEFSSRVVVGDPAGRIVAAAREEEADLVVMATHGRKGVSRWLRGSVAERVLRGSVVPVLLCPPRWLERAFWADGGIDQILVPLDGSEQAASVLPLAEDLARQHDATLLLLRVGPALSGVDEDTRAVTRLHLERSLEDECTRIAHAGITVVARVVLGEVADEILLHSRAVDLVAMTTHGRTGAARWLLGSVAEQVLRGCERPLLLVRAGG